MEESNEKKYSLDELCSLTDFSKRTVRFYMGQGLVDRGLGVKKFTYYTETHLLQLLEIKKWQKAGLSLERIKEILHEKDNDELPPVKRQAPGSIEVWSHLLITDGISLQIEPTRSGLTPQEIRELSKKVMDAFDEIKASKKSEVETQQELKPTGEKQ